MAKNTIAALLKRSIESSGKTRYAIAKGAGVEYSVLLRFLDHGRDIRLSTVEALAEYLGLEMKPARKVGQ